MEFTAATTSFAATSDIVVVGTNPEMADMSNPRGHLFGEAWSVIATNTHGDQRALYVGIGDADQVQEDRLAQRLNQLAVIAQYGSPAYVEYGQDDDVAAEREAEAWSLYSDFGHACN